MRCPGSNRLHGTFRSIPKGVKVPCPDCGRSVGLIRRSVRIPGTLNYATRGRYANHNEEENS
jgi:hypothetical protein